MDVVADLEAPYPAAVVWDVVSDLGTYPEWLDIVARAVPAGDAAWTVDLRGRVGPFARSKRLRMARTLAQAPNNVLFEREELDGSEHSAWVLRAGLEDTRRRGMHARMRAALRRLAVGSRPRAGARRQDRAVPPAALALLERQRSTE